MTKRKKHAGSSVTNETLRNVRERARQRASNKSGKSAAQIKIDAQLYINADRAVKRQAASKSAAKKKKK